MSPSALLRKSSRRWLLITISLTCLFVSLVWSGRQRAAGVDCVTQVAHCGDVNISQLLTDHHGTGFSRTPGGPVANVTTNVDIVANTPSVTGATTVVNTQTTSGLVITRNAADGSEVTNFKISNIQNGALFQNDGTTQINNGDFITFAEGNAGLKFTPAANLQSPGTTFSFDVQASLNNTNAGLGGAIATATITVNCGPVVVTNSNDSGAGSLRATINSACAGATITFDMTAGHVNWPITLISGELLIDKSLTIAGPPTNTLMISGDHHSRIFNISVPAGGATSLSGMTIANGKSNAQGGAIFDDGGGTLTISNSDIVANVANVGDLGGAIFIGSKAGTVNITDSWIRNNSAPSGLGGGLANTGSATVNISRSLFFLNAPGDSGSGGAISNLGAGALNINNSTFSSNSAGNGGAIYNGSTGPVVLNNCTVTENHGGNGGGIASNGTARVQLRNTIVAGNTAGSGPDLKGTFTSRGHNLIGNNSGTPDFTAGSPNANADLVGTAGAPIYPGLSGLSNHGGPTDTHALLPRSPALDAGDNCVTEPTHCGDPTIGQMTTDQRGGAFSRTVDGADADSAGTVDIGAFEAQVSMEPLEHKTINEDTQLQFSFNVGGEIISARAFAYNMELVPDNPANILVTGSGSTRTLTINPAANQTGNTTIVVAVDGNHSQIMIDTFFLTVNPVNDAPSFTTGANQTVNENAGAQTVSGFLTAISPGPDDESGQIVTLTATNDNNALFATQPVIASNGTLTYTPATNAHGSATVTVAAKDNGGSANGGSDTSAPQRFTITVNAVNDAPSFMKGSNQIVDEDAGAQTIGGWATSISAGPADESNQTVTFKVTNNNDGLLSSPPAVGANGALTYTPAANANGSATVSVTAQDNGGTAFGGKDTSPAQTFTITVNAVNDAPTFTRGSDQTVSEDAGAQAIPWTTISSGPANESGQTITFTVTNNNNALFSSPPAVGANGTLTYTPAANANGSATVSVTAKDDGGTANGGSDTSALQTFTITINSVNDAPSFTRGADQSVSNTGGTQTVANWATNISAGPDDESSQSVTFQIIGNTKPGLFTAGPAVSSSGSLTYTPSTSAGGTATVSVVAKDNGGTADGGLDTSTAQTFTITVTPVGGFVNFASGTGSTTENSGSTRVDVTRSGDTTTAVTVSYTTNGDTGLPCATANGVASPKCDFTASLGTLNFAAGETSKPITILLSQDSFVEGPETITLTLSSPTGGAVLGTLSTMTVTIADDVSEPPTNIIDDANSFVRMHYHDFLNREGDQSGTDFWTGQINNCGSSDIFGCRVNVSGAFFLSIEFQQTGYLVERMYKTGYGEAAGTSIIGGSHQIFVPVVRANEFLTDTQRIGRGVVVLQPGWETVLENNKQAYVLEFVQASRFTTAFPTSMSPAQFVDKLNANAGGVLSVIERQTVINLFGNSVDTTNVTARAQALRQVAEDQDLYNAEFNRAFVLTQYIGYLRRNPNDAPEPTVDYTGYDFWLAKLNQFNGDYIAAEMVKAFISSDEYRKRFGP